MKLYLKEDLDDGVNVSNSYRDIYSEIVRSTNNFEMSSGMFQFINKADAEVAKNILETEYSKVEIDNSGDDEVGGFYYLAYDKKINEKLEKKNKLKFSKNPDPTGTPLGSWSGLGSFGEDYEEDMEVIKRYSDVVPKENRKYWYFTTHGVQPGSIPKGVNVLDIKDGKNAKGTRGTFVCLDAILNTDELRKYDMKEERPVYESKERKPYNLKGHIEHRGHKVQGEPNWILKNKSEDEPLDEDY